jgi:hypothetical protein
MSSPSPTTPNTGSAIRQFPTLSQINIDCYPLLYLPVEKTINNEFFLKVTQEWGSHVGVYDIYEAKTLYTINPCYVSSRGITIEAYGLFPTAYDLPTQVEEVLKKGYYQKILYCLNQIEYALSLPLEDLPLHLEDAYPVDDLVLWRLELPREDPSHAHPNISFKGVIL